MLIATCGHEARRERLVVSSNCNLDSIEIQFFDKEGYFASFKRINIAQNNSIDLTFSLKKYLLIEEKDILIYYFCNYWISGEKYLKEGSIGLDL